MIAQRSSTDTCGAYGGIAPNPFVITSKKCPVGADRTLLRRDDEWTRRDAAVCAAGVRRGSLGDHRLHPRAAAQPKHERRAVAGERAEQADGSGSMSAATNQQRTTAT